MATGTNTQVFDGALKDDYEDFVAEGVNNKNKLKELFKFSQIPHGGREKRFTAHVRRNAGTGFASEDGAFPVAGAQKYVQSNIKTKKLMGRVRYTQEVLDDSVGDEQSFVDARKDEMDRLIDDLAKKEEWSMCSVRGILGFVDGDPGTGVTLEMDAPGGIVNDNFGNRFVQEDMFLAAVDPATGNLRAGIVKVQAVNEDGTDVTTTAAINAAWADNDLIVQAANASVTDASDTSYEQAFAGILELLDNGTYKIDYFGVDRSIYSNPVSSYVKASTGTWSFDVLQQSSDVVDQKSNGRIDKLIVHHSTRRLYLQMTEGDRRYSGAKLSNPDGGTVAFKQESDLTMGEVPLIAVRDFPLDVCIGIDSKGIQGTEYVSEKGRWVDDDGAILVRDGTGQNARHAFEAWYFIRKERYFKYPWKAFRNDAITGQSLVVVRGF